MGRLIDVDSLNITTVGICDAAGNSYECADVVFAEDIKKSPTVDAEPVRHGKLVNKMYYEYYADWANCTLCGEANRADANYCQWCGAKMDLEESVHE